MARQAGELPGRPGKEVRLRLQGADVGEPRSGMSQDSITALAVNRTHLVRRHGRMQLRS